MRNSPEKTQSTSPFPSDDKRSDRAHFGLAIQRMEEESDWVILREGSGQQPMTVHGGFDGWRARRVRETAPKRLEDEVPAEKRGAAGPLRGRTVSER